MKKHLVDVLNDKDNVLHVFPVRVDRPGAPPTDADFERQALKAAVAAKIVPKNETNKLRTRMHVSRGGQLAPVGDALQIKHEQKMRFEQRIRDRAYFLWQGAGCVENRADEYWYRACELEHASIH
jgi:hypothetical protein